MKLKTNKTVSKRFKITGRGKILKRACHQDHFNARDRGEKTCGKRKDRILSETFAKTVKQLIAN